MNQSHSVSFIPIHIPSFPLIMTKPCIITLAFPGCHRRGGVERIVFECARYLASQGHSINVFANEWEVDETQPSIRYEYVPMRRKPGFLHRASFQKSCTQRLAGFNAGVLNTHGCICPFGGVLRVHSIHRDWLNKSRLERSKQSGTESLVASVKQRLNPMHPVLLRLESQHLRERRYRKVIALSQQVKESINKLYDVPAEDVEIIPNGFAPGEFNPEARLARRNAMRDYLGLKVDQVVLLFVANELERKGYRTIIDAMRLLNRSDIRLLVVGRNDPIIIRQIADRAGVGHQVLACGPTDCVPDYHAAADLFVLPTQYEAFCLAILEALGSGIPVITSAVPGAMDAIVPGENGSVIHDPNSGAQLAAALEPYLEADYRGFVTSKAASTVQAYQWPVVMARYTEILLRFAH